MINRRGHLIYQSEFIGFYRTLQNFYYVLGGFAEYNTQRNLCPLRIQREEQAGRNASLLISEYKISENMT